MIAAVITTFGFVAGIAFVAAVVGAIISGIRGWFL